MTREAIQQQASALQIPYLVHFTQSANLHSILEHGLYPRASVARINPTAIVNDPLRLDGRPEATSLSIAFPNFRMFYRYRMQTVGSDWVVLIINPQVLWQVDCAFCKHNAADARIAQTPLAELQTLDAFNSMYLNIEGIDSRDTQRLRPYDPTDAQAEVLAFEVIPPQQIYAVVFQSRETQSRFDPLPNGRTSTLHSGSQGFFASRTFCRTYNF